MPKPKKYFIQRQRMSLRLPEEIISYLDKIGSNAQGISKIYISRTELLEKMAKYILINDSNTKKFEKWLIKELVKPK